MKVRLTRTIPVGPEHGLCEGRIVDANPRSGYMNMWVKGDADEYVCLLPHEFEALDEEDQHHVEPE